MNEASKSAIVAGLVLLGLAAWTALSTSLSNAAGDAAGYRRATTECVKEIECGCGDERSCAFGIGIVGRQHCTYNHRWSRCEPDPSYKTPITATP